MTTSDTFSFANSNPKPSSPSSTTTAATTSTTVVTDGAVVRLRDVDDFVGLAAACVNPLFTSQPVKTDSHGNESTAMTTPTSTSQTDVVIPKKRRQQRPQRKQMKAPESTDATPAINTTTPSATTKQFTTATMADCLACSGCVTTAETVVLEQHTTDVFRQKLAVMSKEEPCGKSTIVLMISPASFADILRYVLQEEDQQHEEEAVRKNEVLLRYQLRFVSLLSEYLGIHHVLDGNVALASSRKLAAEEFCNAYRQAKQQLPHDETTSFWTDTEQYERDLVPSRAISNTRTQYWIRHQPNNRTTTTSDDGGSSAVQTVEVDQVPSLRKHQALPLLSSSCPAVVCVVEKSKHALVRHLSTIVSPMITTSAVVVTSSSHHPSTTRTNDNNHSIVTIAVMPCHDKKLEASRTDFSHHSVDMVITSRELVDVLRQTVREQQPISLESSEPADEQKILDWFKEQLLLVTTQPKSSIQIAEHCIVEDIKSVTHKIQLSNRRDTDESFFYTLPLSSVLSYVGIGDGQDTAATSPTEEPFVFGSGGYADFIFRHAARELFGITKLVTPIWRPVVVTSETSMKSVGSNIRSRRRAHPKRREYYQATLCRRSIQQEDEDLYYVAQTDDDEAQGQVVLRFAIAYGMQTAQPLLDDLIAKHHDEPSSSSSSSGYHYIELMACGHGGCLNGGGQIVTQRETPAETRHRVHSTQHHFVSVKTSQSVENTETSSFPDQYPFYTRYHIVPPMQHAWGAAAGVAVQDTQW